MATGYTRNDTTNNIANGNIINAADLDGEFDAIQAAYDVTTGHDHDGTVGGGAPIRTLGPAQDVVITTSVVRPKTDNTVDLGTSTLEFKDLYLDGTAKVDTLTVDENASVTGTLNVTGTTTLGTVNVTTIDTTNLEVTNLKAKDGTSAGSIADTTGVVTLASSVLTTADINGGTIDGVTIATSDITVGSGKTLNVSAGTLTLADNQISGDKVEGGTINAITITTLGSTTGNITTVNSTTVDTTNLEVTNLKAKDGTAAGSIANSTGVVTLASSVLTTTDINGGTVDGAVIGGASAAAGTFTTATATTGNITTVNATTVDTTNIEVTNIKAKDGTASATIADTTGVMTVASLVATTADINGGTVDNATIATSDITVGAGKTLNVSAGTLTLADNQISGDKVEGGTINAITINTLGSTTGNITTVNATTVDTTNIEVTTIKAKDGTSAGSIADSTGVVTLASSVLTTTDINGGTVDGAVIGGSSAAAITGTTITATGDVTIADKIIHAGDTNTAIRFPLADTVTMETSGIERFRIDALGRVGIGVTNQVLRLQVAAQSSSASTVIAATDTDYTATFRSSQLIYNPVDTTGTLYGVSNSNLGALSFLNCQNVVIGTNGNVPMVFATNSTERMRITGAGNVGIGTTGPTEKLDVSGNINTTLATYNFVQVNSGTVQAQFAANGGGVAQIRTVSDHPMALFTNNLERMRITSAGLVGIGTTAPQRILHIATAEPTVLLQNTSAAVDQNRWRTRVNTSGNFLIGTANDAFDAAEEAYQIVRGTGIAVSTHIFSTANTERMRITSTGNVGIGTNNPAQLLDVRGNSGSNIVSQVKNDGAGRAVLELDAGGSSDAFLAFKNQATGTARIQAGPTEFLAFGTGSAYTERMRIDSSGFVGVGTSSPDTLLEIVGADPILTIRDTDTSTNTANARIRFAESGASDTLGEYWDVGLNPISALTFSRMGSEHARIDSSGNVGIGTTTITPLGTGITTVAVNGTAGGGILFQRSDATAVTGLVAAVNGAFALGSTTSTAVTFRTNNIDRMRIETDGTVYLGNGASSSTPANSFLFATNGNGTNIAGATMTIQAGRGTGSAVGGPLVFSTAAAGTTGTTLNAATERMRITPAGAVYIGNGEFSTTPANGFLLATGGSGTDIAGASMLIWGGRSTGSAAGGPITFSTSPAGTTGTSLNAATERMRITSTGNVGIGNTTPITPLHVTGATITTGVVYKNQPAQTVESAAATLTIAELLTGIIQYTGALATLTMPTGTAIEGGVPATFPTDMSFDFSVINTGAGVVTLGTATGLTLVGGMTVAAAASGLFRVRKTATNTYTIYRLA